MRLGQISFLSFLSQILASVVGFVATVLITQTLGSGVFGTYALIIAVVIWVKTISIMGIKSAVTKRLSEGGDDGEYIAAGGLVLGAILIVISVVLFALRGRLNAYVGTDATLLIIALTWATAVLALTMGILDGRHLVHYSSALNPLSIGFQSVFQIAAVLLGIGLVGILVGYGAGALLAALVGLAVFVKADVKIPRWHHVRELLSYAQFAWLSRLSNRTFTSMDTLVLGLFVSANLIGIYEVAWNLASLLAIFGTAIGQTLFPEISKISSQREMDEVRHLLEQGLSYTGLFLIPGLVGSAAVGDLVLRVYGTEFARGQVVLVLLILSRLVYAYAKQLLTVLNGIDRPDLSFRINGAFAATNLGLNLLLVWQFGWLGAAVASVTSAVVALAFAYRGTAGILGDISIPVGEIGRQVVAAAVMGLVIFVPQTMLPNTLPVGIGLVTLGAGVYFLLLVGISVQFRTTIVDNLPR
ncbi:MAG: oligosaccharide flippase family protein [Halorientalis sp.]